MNKNEILKIRNSKEKLISTDKYLPIEEIRGDTIIMKDGGLRAILKCSGLNIDLRNAEEQQIIADKYARFLNTLEFPIQIVIRSTYLDLTDYINYVKRNVEKIENEVLKWQGEKYYEFLTKLNEAQGLLFSKEFYVVIPYYGFDDKSKIRENQFNKLMSALSNTPTAESIANKLRFFHRNKKHLNQRVSLVEGQLKGLGLEVKRLNLKEIVGLLFEVYNPLSIKKQAEIVIQ